MSMPTTKTKRLTAGSLILGIGLLSAYGGTNAGASVVPGLRLPGCATKNLPTGFVRDNAHSGSLTPAKYSASGDIQASLLYDGFKKGQRAVYTDLASTTASTTTTTSATGPDLVIECVAMQFPNASDANRFFQSFKYLRTQAGSSVAQKVAVPGRLRGATVGYKEEQQTFSGYNITSTDVVEAANQRGPYFYTVSVAGPSPLLTTASGYLKHIASAA